MSLLLSILQYKYAIIIFGFVVCAVIYILLLNSHTQKKLKKAQQKSTQTSQNNTPQEETLNEQNLTNINSNENLIKGEKEEGEKTVSPTTQLNKEKLENFKNQRLKSIVEKLKPEVQEIILKS